MQSKPDPDPIAVKIVCYVLLFKAALGLFSIVFSFKTNAVSGGLATPHYIAACAILLAVCGGFMLRRANWARILFFAACLPLNLAVFFSWLNHWAMLQIGLALWISLILILRPANRFFTSRDTLLMPKKKPERPLDYSRPRAGKYDY